MPTDVQFSQDIAPDPEKQKIFKSILQHMFPGYQRVVVKNEFATGSFSGSWVYLTSLIREEIPDLPVVVKIAATSLIQKEWRAYQEFIRGRWPRIAEIKDKPQYDEGGAFGGLYYYHAGEGIDQVVSLRQYCLEISPDHLADIQFVLEERLAKIFEYVERNSYPKTEHLLRALYDPVLPVNLLIHPCSEEVPAEPTPVTPLRLPPASLQPDDYVRLEDFVVTKVDLKDDTVTLNLPRPAQDLPTDSYMIRLKYDSTASVPAHYAIGQLLPAPVVGEVLKTRASQWRDELMKVLPGLDFDVNGKTVHASNGTSLPNPFNALERVLSHFRNIKVFYIHGDMNLENILVYPDISDVRLIDFAEARWDHVLHNYLRLETEVVTKLIPPVLAEAGLVPEIMLGLYARLHRASFDTPLPDAILSPHPKLDRALLILMSIRRMVREQRPLFIANDYEEYYECLLAYLLGSLKFSNLDGMPEAPYPKQAAFWGAVAVTALLSPSQVDQEELAQLGVPDSGQREGRTLSLTRDSGLSTRWDRLYRDRPEPASGGNIWVGGDIHGDGNVIGHGASATITQAGGDDAVYRLFAAIYQQIEIHSQDQNVPKEELFEIVEVIQQEVGRGSAADPSRVDGCLKDLAVIAPDIARATVARLKGSAVVPYKIRQIAAKVGRATDQPRLPAPD
jgi:hypothetical protein